jgi:ankyrin repeat protein
MEALVNVDDQTLNTVIEANKGKKELGGSSTRKLADLFKDWTLPGRIFGRSEEGSWGLNLFKERVSANPKLNESVKTLTQHVGELNDEARMEMLKHAVRQGHTHAVEHIISSNKFDLDATDSKGLTAAHHAAAANDLKILEMLKNAGANMDTASNNTLTPLMHGARSNAAATVKYLSNLEGMDINKTDADGRTALFHAAQSGSLDTVKELLKAGADPNIKDKFDYSAIHAAAQRGDAAMIKLLTVEAEDNNWKWASTAVQDKLKLSPLMLASAGGHTEATKELLLSGALPYARNAVNKTALDMATNDETKKILEEFYAKAGKQAFEKEHDTTAVISDALKASLEYNHLPDEALKNFNLLTNVVKTDKFNLLVKAVDSFAKIENKDISELSQAQKTELVKVLEIFRKDSNGDSLVQEAGKSGHIDALKVLRDLGLIDMGLTNISLHDAAEKGNLEAIIAHKLSGADLNAKTNSGWTPAHSAANNGKTEALKTLHALGADLNAKTNSGWTPAHSAANNGKTEALKTLHALGADLNAKSSDNQTPFSRGSDSTKTYLRSIGINS